jgi:hypothetical protein
VEELKTLGKYAWERIRQAAGDALELSWDALQRLLESTIERCRALLTLVEFILEIYLYILIKPILELLKQLVAVAEEAPRAIEEAVIKSILIGATMGGAIVVISVLLVFGVATLSRRRRQASRSGS